MVEDPAVVTSGRAPWPLRIGGIVLIWVALAALVECSRLAANQRVVSEQLGVVNMSWSPRVAQAAGAIIMGIWWLIASFSLGVSVACGMGKFDGRFLGLLMVCASVLGCAVFIAAASTVPVMELQRKLGG
jgi:hypothetical protein